MNKRIYLTAIFLLIMAVKTFSQTDSVFLETLFYPGTIPESGESSDNKPGWDDETPLVTPVPTINTNYAVGTTTGIADVSPTGAATYHIPIQVPQGVNGFEPSVSLNYNSQTGLGLMGYGWHLAAFSSISRCGKTFYHDGKAESPQLTSSDNLMLDGQRLMLISGTNLVNGAKYRMEYDPYTDITYKTVGSYTGFVVRTKDGVVKEFGYTAKSNITSSNISLFWLLSKVTDKNGNAITYEYETVANNGEFYLTKIQYATNRSIQFSYETRTDKQKTYFAGTAINNNKRLKSITTYINTTQIKQYQFNYVYDEFYSKLNEIIESGQNGERFNSIHVDYGNPEVQFKEYSTKLSERREGNLPLFADFNGDGKMDFLSYPEKVSYTARDVATLFLSTTSVSGVQFVKKCTIPLIDGFKGFLLADLNGDGKVDAVQVSLASNGSYRYNYYMFDGEKFTYNHVGFNTDGDEALVGDFNGDGKHEILIIKNQKVFNGQGSQIASGGLDNLGVEFIKDYYPNNRHLYDLTGNGKANILVTNSSSGWVYELNGNSFERLTSYNTTEIKNSYRPFFGDFNGDGLIDVLIQNIFNYSDVSILFSTGKGFVKQNVSDLDIQSDVFIGDFNRDGKSDIFHLKEYNGSIRMMVGTYNGSSFTTKTYSSQSLSPDMLNINYVYRNYLYQVADFDGDGRAEFCSALFADFYTIEVFPDNQTLQAKKITNGLGAQTLFNYGPITNGSICTNTGNSPTFPLIGKLFPLSVVRSMEQMGNGEYYDYTIYHYKNPKVHLQGKGFMGFEEVSAVSSYKNRKIITQYGYNSSYYYPYVTQQKVMTESGTPISTTTFENTNLYQGNKRVVPYIKKQIETDHLTGVIKTVDITSVDSWGAPLKVVTQYGNDVTETVDNTYFNSQTDNLWIFNLPLSTQKATSKSGSNWVEKQVFEYNAKALLSKQTTYTNGSRQVLEDIYQYNTFGNLTSISSKAFSSSNTLTTTYKYSADGVYQTSVTDPMNLETSWVYNNYGLITSSKDPFNQTTTYAYDGMGRLKSTTYPDQTTSTITYSWYSSIQYGRYSVTETQTGKPTVITYFDEVNRELRNSITGFDGSEYRRDKKYDNSGRVSRESLPFKGNSATGWDKYTYDVYGRLTRIVYASGKVDTYSYSGRTTTTNVDGISTQKTVNAKGELISVSDPAGTITYNLRPDGLPNSIIAPGNVTTTFGYDEYGRQIQITDPSAGKKTFAYDAAGYLKEETDANNRKKIVTCDKYGRIITKQLPELTTTYRYNVKGLLESESSTNGTSRTYTYDALGRLSKERDNAPDSKWLEKTYTYSGDNLSSIAFTSHAGAIGTESYIYSNGHLSEIKIGSTSIWKLSQENNIGLPISAVTGPVTRTYTYNNYGIPTGRSASSSSGGTFQNFTYSFDIPKGNLTSRTDARRDLTESFTYDNLNRLSSYYGGTMNYDVKGNITRKHDVGTTFHYGLSVKPYAMTRVEVGDKTAIAQRNQSVTYTSFERPASITENNYDALFTYDGSGSRKKMQIKKNNSVERQRYYLGDRYEGDYGIITKQILYLGGNAYSAPAAYVNEGSSWVLYYICRDYLGSITHIVNANGTIKEESSYDAWGRLRNVSSYGTVYSADNTPALFLNRGYTGHEHLSMFGLINMNARLYDPAIGRFLSPDPYVQAPDFSQNFNRYSYGMNNPLKFVDPDGELAWFIPLIAAAIGGTTNLVANWKNVNGFWQGLATFGVGAGAGLATAVTAGTGAAALGVAGVAAGSSALTGATNNIVAQTGHNFSGFGNIDWGQVGINSAVSGVAGFVGAGAGSWAANSSWVVNGISHPLVKTAVISPISAGAGHIAGGTTAGLLQGQNLNEAFANSFKGIGQSMALGGGLGVATTVGMIYASGINPITGLHLKNRNPLPDYIYSKKAQLSGNRPDNTDVSGVYINDKGIPQPWNAKYDHYGRLIERTDFNAGNRVEGIPSTHYHQYKWLPKGQMNSINHIPGIGPKTGWGNPFF